MIVFLLGFGLLSVDTQIPPNKTNMSHQWKKKLIFPTTLGWDMLVSAEAIDFQPLQSSIDPQFSRSWWLTKRMLGRAQWEMPWFFRFSYAGADVFKNVVRLFVALYVERIGWLFRLRFENDFLEIAGWWWINYQTFHGGGQRYTSPEIEQGVPKSTTWNIFFFTKNDAGPGFFLLNFNLICWGVHFLESKNALPHPTKLTLRHWKNGWFPILSFWK